MLTITFVNSQFCRGKRCQNSPRWLRLLVGTLLTSMSRNTGVGAKTRSMLRLSTPGSQCCWRHDVVVNHVGDESHLPCHQWGDATVGREGVVHLLPEDGGVDDANVQRVPEDVFPPPPASTAHTLVSLSILSTPSFRVILPDTAWSWHVTRHIVPPQLSHHMQPLIVRRNHVDVTPISPLHQHDAVIIRSLDGLTWL